MATVSKGKLKLQRLNKINVPLVGLIIISTWSYENRVSKHFVIVLSFPCLIACLLCCLLMSFFFFAYLLVRNLCRSGCIQNYYLSLIIFVPTHNSLFNTSDNYLKSVRA